MRALRAAAPRLPQVPFISGSDVRGGWLPSGLRREEAAARGLGGALLPELPGPLRRSWGDSFRGPPPPRQKKRRPVEGRARRQMVEPFSASVRAD